MATSTDDNVADGNLDKRNIRLIKLDHTRAFIFNLIDNWELSFITSDL